MKKKGKTKFKKREELGSTPMLIKLFGSYCCFGVLQGLYGVVGLLHVK